MRRAWLGSLLLLASCSSDGIVPGEDMLRPLSGCVTNGTFAFELSQPGLDAYDGDTARIVAMQPQSTPARVVDIAATITNGTLGYSCANALSTSDDPSVAVFIDLNDDHACDAGDVGQTLQQFLWEPNLNDEPFTFSGAWQPVETLAGVNGGNDGRFCADYFD